MKKYVVVTVAMIAIAITPIPAVANETIVERALGFVGIRYRFASESESRGFDCAGLVRRTFAAVGIELPRTTREQFRLGAAVVREELMPGDLVFFRNTYRKGISHVGIYIGEGRFVHAASTARQVIVDRLDSPYYRARFAGGRRIAAEAATAVAGSR